MAQLAGTLDAFREFLKNEQFVSIIEIGTGSGMFTAELAQMFSGQIYTFDIMRREYRVEFPRNVVSDIQDVFRSKIHQSIKRMIESPGRVLLLCDGGNKPKEVNTFGVYLKPNDVIMAHDLGYEIQESDVQLDNIEPFYNDLFLPVCWLCLRRKADE